MKEDKLIQEWLSKETSADNFDQLEKAIALSENLEIPGKTSHEDAWAGLLDKINTEASDNERLMVPAHQSNKRWMVWAASIAAIFVLGYFSLRDMPTPSVYSTKSANTLAHTLPENSIITLNANSSISLIEESWTDNRVLSLIGEAFFEVSPGSKFTVLTDMGEISVLGTSFNVFVRENELQVSTFTGVVKVEKDGKSILLEKGDQLSFTTKKESWSTTQFNLNHVATWRSGAFHFNSIPLQKVVNELERQFAIEIEVASDISQSIYSGFFSKTDLNEALQLVFVPMGMKYKIDGNKVNVQ